MLYLVGLILSLSCLIFCAGFDATGVRFGVMFGLGIMFPMFDVM